MPGGASIRVARGSAGPGIFMGGICEFASCQATPITEDGFIYALDLRVPRFGLALKRALAERPVGNHFFSVVMQAEDAPQRTNRVDLDPAVKDLFGLPVPRVTYAGHAYERSARDFYVPILRRIVENAGAPQAFVTPCDAGPPRSRHVMGTLRMGSSPGSSVTRADGRFWDVDNLYACDGSVFPTSSGYNPTLTIIAVALRIAHGIAGTSPSKITSPGRPQAG
jgi:choline dehydrogenase-like flavoprotein